MGVVEEVAVVVVTVVVVTIEDDADVVCVPVAEVVDVRF